MTPDQLSLHRLQALHIYPPSEGEKSVSANCNHCGNAWFECTCANDELCSGCGEWMDDCTCMDHDERTEEDVEAGKPHTSGADFYTNEEA